VRAALAEMRLAPEREHARARRVPVLEQVLDGIEFFLRQADLLRRRLTFGIQAGKLVLKLLVLFLNDRQLSAQLNAAHLEELLLAGNNRLHRRVLGRRGGQLSWNLHLRLVQSLGHQPRFAGNRQEIGVARPCESLQRVRVFELNQNRALFDDGAVFHMQRPDHAAGRMLNLLTLGGDDDLAVRDHGARDWNCGAPEAESAERKRNHAEAHGRRALRGHRNARNLVWKVRPAGTGLSLMHGAIPNL
jgi:hypothetical protein